jgi:hypothetical protein
VCGRSRPALRDGDAVPRRARPQSSDRTRVAAANFMQRALNARRTVARRPPQAHACAVHSRRRAVAHVLLFPRRVRRKATARLARALSNLPLKLARGRSVARR